MSLSFRGTVPAAVLGTTFLCVLTGGWGSVVLVLSFLPAFPSPSAPTGIAASALDLGALSWELGSPFLFSTELNTGSPLFQYLGACGGAPLGEGLGSERE